MPLATQAEVDEQLFQDIRIMLDYARQEPWEISRYLWLMTRDVGTRSGALVVREMLPALKSGGEIVDAGELLGEITGPALAAIAGFWLIITMLAALDILLLIGCLHGLLRAILGTLPNWGGVRNKVVGFVDIAFRFDQVYARWVADNLTAAIISFIHGLAFLIQLFSGMLHWAGGKLTPVPVTAVPKAIINQIRSLTVRVSRIEQEIHSATHISPTVPGTITAQLHSLHTQVADLYNKQYQLDRSLTHLYSDHRITASELHKLESVVSTLKDRLTGVRAVHVSAPDILKQLDTEVERLEKWRPQIEQQISHMSSSLVQLAPLTMLLTGGIGGLRMLRTLEDEPCQCGEPAPPKMPATTGDDIWGLYEYFSEG